MLIGRGARARAYADLALTPVADDEAMDLFSSTTGAPTAVAHLRKVAAIAARSAAA